MAEKEHPTNKKFFVLKGKIMKMEGNELSFEINDEVLNVLYSLPQLRYLRKIILSIKSDILILFKGKI